MKFAGHLVAEARKCFEITILGGLLEPFDSHSAQMLKIHIPIIPSLEVGGRGSSLQIWGTSGTCCQGLRESEGTLGEPSGALWGNHSAGQPEGIPL